MLAGCGWKPIGAIEPSGAAHSVASPTITTGTGYSICFMSRQASTVIDGQAGSLGAPIQITKDGVAYLVTPMTFTLANVAKGASHELAAGNTTTVYFVGSTDPDGATENGPTKDPNGVGLSTHAFVLNEAGGYPVVFTSGWFWRETDGLLHDVGRYKAGVSQSAFDSEATEGLSGKVCPEDVPPDAGAP